jgi:hypothetical protein
MATYHEPMQLRAWIAVAVIGVAGYVAGRGEEPKDEPAKLEAPARSERVVTAAPPPPSLAPSLHDDDTDDTAPDEQEPEQPAEIEADQPIIVEKPLPEAGRNTVHGRMRDAQTGELLAGVTIVAASVVLEGAQTAITDENGYYRITELPTGVYTITVYYMDTTLEHGGVVVGLVPSVIEDDIDTTSQGEAAVLRITEEE